MPHWNKWSIGTILIFLIILFGISFPLVEKGSIFSNIFVDSYAPRKVLVIEKSGLRIVYLGEFRDDITSKTIISNLDNNLSVTKPTQMNAIVAIIRELRLIKNEPKFPLNERTIIDVDSRLTGDRSRSAGKTVVVGADGEVKEVKSD